MIWPQFGNSEASTDEPDTPAPLVEARRLLKSKEYQACLHLISTYWLDNPQDPAAIEAAADLARALGREELYQHLTALAQDPDKVDNDPQSLFDVAFRLIDERQYELAVMLLKRASQILPGDGLINYELGFALMSVGKHAEAIGYFAKALEQQDDFDTRLNLAACYLLARDADRVKEMLAAMSTLASNDEEAAELAHQRVVLRRLEELSEKPVLNARDWLFVQYGTVLLGLAADPDTKGVYGAVSNDYAKIAATLVVLRAVLDALGERFEVVEFYSPLSRPLAQATGDLIGLPVEPYAGRERQERALLVMAWASDIIGPHLSFAPHEDRRTIFALGLTSLEPLPVTPDIAGLICQSCAMPWDEHWQVEERSDLSAPLVRHVPAEIEDPQKVANRIVEKARALEADPELLLTIEEAIAYYSLKHEWLVVGNAARFPRRPEYRAEMPA